MKYEIKIVKLGFLGKDKIDIEEFAKEGGFLYGIFDEFGVLEKNRCEENSAFFYTNKNAGHGVFFRNQTNEKTRSAEVLLTVNERMTKKEYYSDSFFMEKMVETVKKFFHAVKIYENDRLITEEMLEDGRYFGRSQSEYDEIWKNDFYDFAENTKDGFVQGPLFPLFIDEDNLNSFQCYTNQVYPMAEYDHQYVKREYFIDDDTDKKVIRWFLEENRSAVMPVDLRTIKEHWGASAVISINGKDYPYDLTVDVMKSNYDVQNYDRRQIQHPKFSKVQLKRIAETVEKRLKTDQFPDFNFKLVVISNIVHKNPDFKEKLEDVYDYAKRYSSYSKDFIDSNVVEILKEIVLTKKDLAKVTHLCLSRENDFFFEIKPNWSGEDSLFDIESFQGIELLENLDTYFFDGELCSQELQEKLCDFGEVFDKNDDHDKTDYSDEDDEDEDYEDESDDDDEDEDDDAIDEEAENRIYAQNLFSAYKTYMDLSITDDEKAFVKEMIEKYCKEYDPSDSKKNNRLGVLMLHYNGCCLFQKFSKEIRETAFINTFSTDYVKNYLSNYDPINELIEENEGYKKIYHLFPNETDNSSEETDNKIAAQENIKNIIEILKEKTSKIVYEMDFDEEKEANVFDSKFLGLPYWNMKMEYPKDKDGNKMVFMGQINFSHEKIDNDLLPKSGILQFFYPNNDFEWDEKDYKLIYHKDSEIDFNYTKEDAKSLNLPEPGEYCYLTKELPFSLVKSTSIINASCNGFEDYVKNAINQLISEKKFVYSESLPENEDVDFYYDELFEDLIEVIYESDEDCNCTSSMLGYPAFTQDDPREDEDDEYYDTLLLKLDSAGNDNICIGDCGIVNLFINSKDLKNLKFDNTFYTWDCY